MDSEGTQILMFHRVRPDEPAAFGLPSCYRVRGTSLTVEELAQVLDRLGGRVIPLEAVEVALAQRETPPPGFVLTFDDGYREHLDLVAPTLVKRGMVATFYVATGLHGDGERVAAVDAWYWLLDHAQQGIAQIELPDGTLFRGRLDTQEGKHAWVTGPPKQALLDADAEGQATLLSSLATTVGVGVPAALAAETYLRRAEWRELVRLGMRVGAHSVTHPRLATLSEAGLIDEVTSSIQAISDLGGGSVPFAYPDGSHDPAIAQCVMTAGASSGVTCNPGRVSATNELSRLPRRFVSCHSGPPTTGLGCTPAEVRSGDTLRTDAIQGSG